MNLQDFQDLLSVVAAARAAEPFSFRPKARASYRWILPPAGMLERYAQIHPGGLQWLLDQTERQIEHRQAMEAKKLDHDIAKELRGQHYAFITSMTVLVIGGGLVFAGRSTSGGIALIVLALAAFARVFICTGKSIASELARKRATVRGT
jgi:uncharacterized membrane protein